MATCLYCDKKLGWVCNTEYTTDETKPPRVCGVRRYHYVSHGKESFTCRSKRFTGTAGSWVCADDDCRAGHSGRRQITSRAHRYNLPGPLGDGVFCSKEHGLKFGRLAAKAGYRKKPSQ